MEFVWSDELAVLLVEEDGIDRSELSGWLATPIAYRLPEDTCPLGFGRELLERERPSDPIERYAS